MSAQQELVVIEPANALKVFTTENALDPYIALVQAEIDKFTPDLTTNKGRDAIRSMAAKVAKIKTYVEGVGKELKDEQAKIPKLIDKGRNYAWEKLEAMQKAVRKPLDDWEAAEAKRIAGHQERLAEIVNCTSFAVVRPSAQGIKDRIDYLKSIEIDDTWEEFTEEGDRAKTKALADLNTLLDEQTKYENEQAELEELRRQKAERDAKEAAEAAAKAKAEYEEKIRQEAAAKAQREAEEKAEAERKAEADRIAQERAEANQKLVDAENRARAEREAAARREEEHQKALEHAKQEAAETEARIKREQEAAAKREREELERRERNKRHAAKINNEAAAGLVVGGLTEEQAKLVVTLVAKKQIPHIVINY